MYFSLHQNTTQENGALVPVACISLMCQWTHQTAISVRPYMHCFIKQTPLSPVPYSLSNIVIIICLPIQIGLQGENVLGMLTGTF